LSGAFTDENVVGMLKLLTVPRLPWSMQLRQDLWETVHHSLTGWVSVRHTLSIVMCLSVIVGLCLCLQTSLSVSLSVCLSLLT